MGEQSFRGDRNGGLPAPRNGGRKWPGGSGKFASGLGPVDI